MSAWSHLPNAHLIDWVLESLKTNPNMWATARDVNAEAAWGAIRVATRVAAWNVSWNSIRVAARDAAREAAREATLYAARDAALYAARDAIHALIAYDDCDQYLTMNYDQLLTYAALSEKPQAILLLPLKWVQEQQSVMT